MTDKPMTVTVEDQLYSALKEIYEAIDHNDNPKLKNEEYINLTFKYSGEMQAKIRRALSRKEAHDRSSKPIPPGTKYRGVPYDQIDPLDYETYSEFKSAKERAKAQEMEAMNDR
jgi:hypothetical protein